MQRKELQYKLKKKPNKFLTVFVAIWTIGVFGLILTIIYGLYTTPSRINDFIIIVGFMIIGFLLGFDYINWQIRGKEILTVSENNIEIKNTGTFFKRHLIIQYYELEKITFDNNKETLHWIRFWGIGGGLIKIEYLGRKKRFGQDLKLKEAEKICNEINEYIEKIQPPTTNKHNAR